MTRKQRRIAFLAGGLATLAVATVLVLTAFSDSLVFFYSPTDVKAKAVPDGRLMRIGGLVEPGSVKKTGDGTITRFVVTDNQETLAVSYQGLLPDLFREGQGVVAQGKLKDGTFIASEVLAKHDENYMPPEVAEALKKSGQWKGPQS